MEPEAIAALFPGHYEARVAGGYKLMIAAKEDGSMMGRAFGREDKGPVEARGKPAVCCLALVDKRQIQVWLHRPER
jgi:hypothetical protein